MEDRVHEANYYRLKGVRGEPESKIRGQMALMNMKRNSPAKKSNKGERDEHRTTKTKKFDEEEGEEKNSLQFSEIDSANPKLEKLYYGILERVIPHLFGAVMKVPTLYVDLTCELFIGVNELLDEKIKRKAKDLKEILGGSSSREDLLDIIFKYPNDLLEMKGSEHLEVVDRVLDGVYNDLRRSTHRLRRQTDQSGDQESDDAFHRGEIQGKG